MHITWYGLSCFKIVSGETSILVSLFGKETGLNPPRGKADIVLISEDGQIAPEGAGFVISGEGEYEVRGVLVNGFSSFRQVAGKLKKSTIYTLWMEGISLCHFNNASKEHIESLLEKVGEVDVLMIPVGGTQKQEAKTLNAEEAVAVVAELEPRIVIPTYFKVPRVKVLLAGPDEFLKTMGASKTQAVEKLTLKKKDLPQEGTQVVLLSCGAS